MNIKITVLALAVFALTASCGQEKHEPALLDTMPAGYDIYITLNPSQIDADAVLSQIGENTARAQRQMPFPIAGILDLIPSTGMPG